MTKSPRVPTLFFVPFVPRNLVAAFVRAKGSHSILANREIWAEYLSFVYLFGMKDEKKVDWLIEEISSCGSST
jgi:hypothetical protein